MASSQVRGGTGANKELQKAWKYIGRFLWHYGIIEASINEIFIELFDLERVAWMFIGKLDTRKKIELIKVGFAEKGNKRYMRLLDEVHKFADLRNVLAHAQFHLAEGGVDIDHITHHGKRWTTDNDMDTFVSYDDFDRYDDKADKIIKALMDLQGNVSPISSISSELQAAMEEAIDATRH